MDLGTSEVTGLGFFRPTCYSTVRGSPHAAVSKWFVGVMRRLNFSLAVIVTAKLRGLCRCCGDYVCLYLPDSLFHVSASQSAAVTILLSGAGKCSPTLCLGRRWRPPSVTLKVLGTFGSRKTSSSQYLLARWRVWVVRSGPFRSTGLQMPTTACFQCWSSDCASGWCSAVTGCRLDPPCAITQSDNYSGKGAQVAVRSVTGAGSTQSDAVAGPAAGERGGLHAEKTLDGSSITRLTIREDWNQRSACRLAERGIDF